MARRETVADLVPAAANAFGDAAAFTSPGIRTWTFREIEHDVACAAGALAAAGLMKGDRVALYLPNGWAWIVCYHAIARLNAVVVPINILLTTEEVNFICSDADVQILIAPAERLSDVMAGRAAGTGPSMIYAIRPDDQTLDDLLGGDPVPTAEVDPDDLFTICYTSGTTGRPKGAMLSHRSVFLSVANTATIHNRSAGERVVSALPFSHVYGNVVMNAAFLAGMHIIAMARFDAKEAFMAITQHRAAMFEGVPTMYYQMLAHPDCPGTDFSSLRRCTVGGQTMPSAKIEAVTQAFGCPLLELWGMTEVGGPAASHSPYWMPRHGTIGLGFPSAELRIMDLGDPGIEASAGTAGELQIRGPQVMRGYWRNPQETSAVLNDVGWLSTGDIAIRQVDGYFRIVDRLKDMIITAGYNIYPAELESILAMHPDVAMVAVVGIPDAEKGELAVAYVVRQPGATCDAAKLDQHCRRRLAPYKVPRRYLFVDELPRTSTGKILRRALRNIEARN